MRRLSIAFVSFAVLVASAGPAATVPPPGSEPLPGCYQIGDAGFNDVSASDEFNDALNCLAWFGIVSGTSSSTYSPDATLTRADMALLLVRVLQYLGVPLPDGSDQGFTDIGGLTPAQQTAINQLAQLGITIGVSPTMFGPGQTVTRVQMALFLVRVMQVGGFIAPLPKFDISFSDLEGLSPEALAAIDQLILLGITLGLGDGLFGPFDLVSRWQMALFLFRLLVSMGAEGFAFTTPPPPLCPASLKFGAFGCP